MRLAHAPLLLLAVDAAFGLGCGTESDARQVGDASGGEPTTTGAGGTATNAGAGGSANMSGGSAGAAGSSTTSDASAITSGGEIVLFVPHFSAGGAYYASFHDPAHPSAPSTYSCTAGDYGPCHTNECTAIDAGANTATFKMPQAGAITVSNGDAGLSETIAPDANGSYPAKSPARSSLVGGELLDFSAAGGDVPAFHEMVQNPLVFLLTEPGLPEAGVLTVSRAQDLKLVWARGIADGTFLLQATSRSGAGAVTTLNCNVSADLGTMTVPAAALSKIAPQTAFQLITVRNHAFNTGPYAVTIRVGTEVATPDKRAAASITVQ
jgi:hypothetical protein